jgi:hypothetical protein
MGRKAFVWLAIGEAYHHHLCRIPNIYFFHTYYKRA